MVESELGCGVSIYNVPKPYEVTTCTVQLTENAATILKELIVDNIEDFQDGVYLYVEVTGGGCSGYLYDVNLESKHPADDTQVILSHGINIIVSNSDSTLLDGIIIDWDDSLMGGGLKFSNPNATKTCSCGISFKG